MKVSKRRLRRVLLLAGFLGILAAPAWAFGNRPPVTNQGVRSTITDQPANPIPEPAAALVFAAGTALVAYRLRKQRP
ncbi:MAG: hypothetical protein MJE66_22460 [Proteobacteria bacterium]|nr:hypothetical protein [Pseudomonadota bacterium]